MGFAPARSPQGGPKSGRALWPSIALAAFLASCTGPQSALDPAGAGAERLADLFWWMAGGAFLVWAGVMALAVYSLRRPESHNERRAAAYIVGGGAALPALVLVVLLGYSLAMIPELVEPPPEGSLRISVVGEQWWWRVRYTGADGQAVEVANEIHLPVGEPVEFLLESADVIHSFWIPPLGGKLDMLPGRTTRLTLYPTRVGVFRGVCAEYCGASHAWMGFDVIVEEPDDFERWLERQSRPARTTQSDGLDLFLAHGCHACHAIRGTPATGTIGPDLTHVGSRLSLAARLLPNGPDAFARWIAGSETIKPGAHMPAFDMLPAADLRALAAYLEALE